MPEQSHQTHTDIWIIERFLLYVVYSFIYNQINHNTRINKELKNRYIMIPMIY